VGFAGYRALPSDGEHDSNRWWDADAEDYLNEHGQVLGNDDFLWCPEGWYERDVHLLGPIEGLDLLEVGSGASQCSRWCTAQGARTVALDLSAGMLRQAARLNATSPDPVPLVRADARVLPFADASFDVAFTAFGALPFVADPTTVHQEVARVLRPGGRWVFSVTHPMTWVFPDDPTGEHLTVQRSYFDRTPYIEEDDDGRVTYAEHHHTLSDLLTSVLTAGLVIEGVHEPEWPNGWTHVWAGWGPGRGALVPGTLIMQTRRP
jgi:SAM-dependent methyltransferase